MTHEQPEQCFVVMPFGIKPMNDGSGRLYDFNKVYRVIIQRAIKEAGLEPVRADERKVSDIVHADMFKQLRDRGVVLADLSLENPNVFYELGVRHVMSARGTVLMCRAGSELPFDVKLSRVIFYDYDGQHLDWEEVERVVRELQLALEEAKRGTPDSPVHALLERVLPDAPAAARSAAAQDDVTARQGEALHRFQQVVADHWAREGRPAGELLAECGSSIFGCRALALLALGQDAHAEDVAAIAKRLHDLAQYDLASRLYAKLDATGRLEVDDLLAYGSVVSELRADLAAVDEGLAYMQRAGGLLAPRLDEESPPDVLRAAFAFSYKIAGLYRWRWQLSHDQADLTAAIHYSEEAIERGQRLDAAAEGFEIGRLAATHLTLLLLLRLRDDDPQRVDAERHRSQILALVVNGRHSPVEESYARWCQAIVLADGGDANGSNNMAMHAFSEDAKTMDRPGCESIGRKQYLLLRRYLEHYSAVLRNPSLIGHISQVLQIGHRVGAS